MEYRIEKELTLTKKQRYIVHLLGVTLTRESVPFELFWPHIVFMMTSALQHLMKLYKNIDAISNDFIDWSEFVEYMLLENKGA